MGVKIASNIIFLGTGGDSYVVGKQLRASGGIILQIDDEQFHIDPGPGSLSMASHAGVNLRANTAVFLSHNHLNHCNDVNAVIDAMTYGGFDRKGVLVGNRSSINGAEGQRPFLQERYKNFVERFIVLEEGKKVGINNLEIEAIKAKHSDPHAIGFRFMTPEYTLTYSGDTSYNAEIASNYDNSNVLILNVPHLRKEEGKDNLAKEDAIKIISRVKPRLAIITHFGANFLKSDPIYEVREIQKETNVQVIAAKDGMVINPLNYSIEQGQKTLYKYDRKEGIRINEYAKLEEEKAREINKMIERQTRLDEP